MTSPESIIKSITLIICLLTIQMSYSQVTNKEVVAKIKTKETEGFINITATAISKTQIIKSLRYTMYVIKTNTETSNSSRGEQTGRFVLQPNQNKSLSTTSINQNIKDKVTVLLLIYDETQDKLIAKDRLVVLNDDNKGETKEILKVPQQQQKEQVNKQSDYKYNGFRGIVTDETRTKPGRDFYKLFYSKYLLNGINGERIVKIIERFSLGRNTIVEIKVDNVLVHQFNVQPTANFLKQQSEQAIIAVTRYFQVLEQQKSYITQNN